MSLYVSLQTFYVHLAAIDLDPPDQVILGVAMGAALGTLNIYVRNILLIHLFHRVDIPPSYEILTWARLH